MSRIQPFFQRWGDTLKFCIWGILMVLVCFLLYRVGVNGFAEQKRVPMTSLERDSLMTVAVPGGLTDTLVRYEAFDVHFNAGWGIANCTAYELVMGELQGQAERVGTFMADAGVKGCPSPLDYEGSGMDRGHLVPAADLSWNAQAIRQSFLMTNVCPMHKALNEGGWAKLEEKVREWAVRDSALLVFTGPVVSDSDSSLASSRVTVPSAYFKVVMAPCVRPRRVIAFIYPNGHSGGRLRQYAVSVDEVESRTGLDFFSGLPQEEQHRLESRVNLDAFVN